MFSLLKYDSIKSRLNLSIPPLFSFAGNNAKMALFFCAYFLPSSSSTFCCKNKSLLFAGTLNIVPSSKLSL